MKKIAIVYHSGFGHTEVQAKSVFQGVKSKEGVEGFLMTLLHKSADGRVFPFPKRF